MSPAPPRNPHEERRQDPPAALVAEFADAESLERAARAASGAGYTRLEAHAPMPLDGLADALGWRPRLLPLLAAGAALSGAIVQYSAQVWMNAVDYPLNVGGRPLHAWPTFIPSTIVVAILSGAVAALLGFLVVARLPRLHHPVFGVRNFERASDDRFFLSVAADDPLFERERTAGLLSGLGAVRVSEARP